MSTSTDRRPPLSLRSICLTPPSDGMLSVYTCQALNLIEHLYQPNLLILFSRMLAQAQIAAAGLVHPNRSLLSLCFMLTLMNATAMLLHLLDHMGGIGKGVMLDFVGQARPASLTRMLLLDLVIYILQVHSISISYLNNKAVGSSPPVPELPYADMLLPISEIPEDVIPEDFDIESGLRRRKGKARAEEEDEEVVWLDDDLGEDADVPPSERDRLLSQSTPSPKRSREPPRIASVSLAHLINLLLYLPTPAPNPTLFAGATPAASPGAVTSALPDTPDREETIYAATDDEDEEGRAQDEEIERRSMVRDRERGSDDEEEGRGRRRDSGGQRMPGDYWVRGRGNGG